MSHWRSQRSFGASVLILGALFFSSQLAMAQFSQLGSTLVGASALGQAQQGSSVAVSADGRTAIVGGPDDNGNIGAAWIYTLNGGVWTQQAKLAGTGTSGDAAEGWSVALSADGNTAIVGGPYANGYAGAAWIYTRSGAAWTQQGSTLVGTGAGSDAGQGYSVALSADGNTAIVGGPGASAAWIFTRSSGVWTQQGAKLVGTGAKGAAAQGWSVALSGDGNTAIVGGPDDNSNAGAAWVFTNNGGVWTQQGAKLVGTGAATANQGYSVALSADGNTAMVGGPGVSTSGSAWVYTRSGNVWTQQGSKLTGTGAVGTNTEQGYSVALSADGNTAIIGGYGDNSNVGAAWAFTRSGGIWTQQGSKLVGTGTVGNPEQGFSVALSADGYTAFVGAPNDNSQVGSALVFVQPALQVTPATDIVATGNPGGPFTPASFQYQPSATVGSFNYSISGVPTWLTPSATVGNTSSATPVTFTVNANGLTAGTYTATITFTNTDTGQGTQTRTATLTVNSLGLQVGPTTGIVASGMQGGSFSPSSFSYTLSAASANTKYTITNVPSWLTASSTSGTLTTAAKTITFKIATSAANKLTPGLYLGNINFNDTTNSQGNTTLIASLAVAPKDYTIKVSASPSADGTVSGGGTFVSGTSQTVTATPNSGHSFVHWSKSGTVVSTSESYTFTLTANVTLVADFK